MKRFHRALLRQREVGETDAGKPPAARSGRGLPRRQRAGARTRAWPDYPGLAHISAGHGRRDRRETSTDGAGTDALVGATSRWSKGMRLRCHSMTRCSLCRLHDYAAPSASRGGARSAWAEARRVLLPGGVLCGSDNLGQRGSGFRLIHLGDSRTVVDPETLPARLKSAGFDRVDVRTGSRLVFHGYTSKAV